MFLKYKTEITVILLSLFFSSTANALNLRELLSGIAADVNVVKKNGSCTANPYSNDAPCLPTKVTCPAGKVPIPLTKLLKACTSTATQPVDFDVARKITLATAVVAGGGSITCNPMSRAYFDNSAFKYYPARPGYSPLCDPITKVCTAFSYTVTARCVSAPDAGDVKQIGVKTK